MITFTALTSCVLITSLYLKDKILSKIILINTKTYAALLIRMQEMLGHQGITLSFL